MKKIFALTLALVMALFGTCYSLSANAYVNVAQFMDWDFYGRSCTEYVGLQMDADTVSFYAECNETPDTPEVISCYIAGVTYPSYTNSFEFTADGTVTTYGYAFPTGLYKIYFVGNPTVLKDIAVVTFTQLD